MKKVCSLFLIIALIMCMLPVYASADEVELVNITINHKHGESSAVRKKLAVIKSGEDLLFSGEDLAALGGFDYRVEKGTAYFTRGLKKVRVDLKASHMYPYDDHPGGSRYTFKEAVQQIDGVYYFPGAEILPWLNVTCFLHEGILNIFTDSISIWELVPEFTPADFAFDFTACCKELGVSGKYLKARAYFQDEGISGVFFDMIPTVGEYLDYYELFDDVVQDLTAAEDAVKDFQEYAEDASYWMEIAEDADLVGEIPDVFRVAGEVAKVFANDAIGFAFDMARYVKYFYTHNDTVLAALFSMDLNSDQHGLPDAASAALVEIRENYSDYYAGIENKMMIAIGETALDGLLDTANGLYEVVVKLMGFSEATSPDWAEGVNRISSYDIIAEYCLRGYEKAIKGTWLSSVQDIRGLAYMYLYACEQNWTAMQKYAIKQGKLDLAAKYKANAIAAEEWQTKFLEIESAEQNDSHEYGDATGGMKQEYTDKLKEMFSHISKFADDPTPEIDFEAFLHNHPEYMYYALLDTNQDGTPELLATESDCSQWGSAFAEVDLFVYRDGEIQLAYENLWSKNTNLMYSKDNQWIVASVSGTGGGGWVFYHLDHNLNVHEQSFESYFEYDENGNEISVDYLNSRKVVTEEDRKAFEQLAARHQFEETSEIIFQPVMGNDTSTLMNNRLSKIKIVHEDGSEYEHLFYYNESGKLSLIEQSGYEWSHYDYNFSYNGDGRLIKMESGDIEQDFYEYKGREFSYDDMGRITTARVFGPGMGWETIHFSYGNDGHISQMEIAIEFEDDPSVYAFNYDTSRNLSEVKSIYPEYDYRSVWSYQYDQWNRVTKEVHTEQYSDGTEYVDELSYSYDYAPFVFCYSEYNIRVYYDFGLLYGEMLNPWISENANVFEPADFYFDEIVDIATDEHGQITALTVTSDYSEGTTTYYFFYSDETNSVENTETKERFQYKNINFSASDILSFEDPEFERFLCVMLGKNRGTITGQDLLSIEYFGYFEGSPTEAESLTNYWDKDTLYWNSVLVSTELCPDFLDERDVLCLTAGEDGLNYRRRGTLVIVQSNEWMAEHVFPYLYYFKNVDRFAFAYCWMGGLVCMPTDANWCQINAHSRDFHLPYDPDYS